MQSIGTAQPLGAENALYQTSATPDITSPKGFTAGGVHCGIKRKRKDLGIILCDVPASAAAVYTTNVFQAPPLKVTQQSLAVEGKLQAFLCNSGNANACTGEQGLLDAFRMRAETAACFGLEEHRVGVVSTGVIGELLPMDRISQGISHLAIQTGKEGHEDFCRSILTTDTCIKAAEVSVEIDGKTVRIAGAAKGSGMIHPNMATMLAFVTTDAVIEPPILQQLLREVTDETYNMITVDGDCSTNDMVVSMASGLAGHSPLTPEHPDWAAFRAGFAHVSRELAKMIARDGEGATKLVEVKVTGAPDVVTAKQAAKAVVGSSLVKTAVFGADPNWGRILCALGYSSPLIDPEHVDLAVGPVQLVKDSQSTGVDEALARRYLEEEHVQFHVHLNQGEAKATAWGCDLTYDYVQINASYRT
jgi:glutamate N-acetyltransferase / amino-acid N-acetyltransferase